MGKLIKGLWDESGMTLVLGIYQIHSTKFFPIHSRGDTIDKKKVLTGNTIQGVHCLREDID